MEPMGDYGTHKAQEAEALRLRIMELEAGLSEIVSKHVAIMKDPPEWYGGTAEQLKTAREAWYGASLIARRALRVEERK
jgi:hypothetical protein